MRTYREVDPKIHRTAIACLVNCEPDDIVTYGLVVITKDDHVKVASEDVHDVCVSAILIDGLQTLNQEMKDDTICDRTVQLSNTPGI